MRGLFSDFCPPLRDIHRHSGPLPGFGQTEAFASEG